MTIKSPEKKIRVTENYVKQGKKLQDRKCILWWQVKKSHPIELFLCLVLHKQEYYSE